LSPHARGSGFQTESHNGQRLAPGPKRCNHLIEVGPVRRPQMRDGNHRIPVIKESLLAGPDAGTSLELCPGLAFVICHLMFEPD